METRQLPPVDRPARRPPPAGTGPADPALRPSAPPGMIGRTSHGAPPTSRAPLTPVAPAPSAVPLGLLAVAAVAGALVALFTIPAWVPTLAASVVGVEPKVFWYLSRASGLVAFVLLWVSMASGLIISNKMARIWPGAFTAFDLHQYTSLLGLGFIVFHMLVLLGDQYIGFSLVQLLVPFAGSAYRPLWVGVGQLTFYLTLLVTFTFYVRKQLGNRMWHLIHFLSYLMFAMALLHGVTSGTDSGNMWVSLLYWLGGTSMLALTIHRLMINRPNAESTAPRPEQAGVPR